jgi:hypothetical protein
MGDSIQIITSDTVKINVSNSQNNVISFEKKFNKSLLIAEMKVSNCCCFFLGRSVVCCCFIDFLGRAVIRMINGCLTVSLMQKSIDFS